MLLWNREGNCSEGTASWVTFPFTSWCYGHTDTPIESVLVQATAFMSACYGQGSCKSMSETRWKVWASKTGQASSAPPKLCCLPLTNESFAENVKRAHYQVIVWRSLEDNNPPNIDLELFGWTKETKGKVLRPMSVPVTVELAPEYILRLIKYGCKSDTPCSTRACSCTRDKLDCTLCCACNTKGCCQNVTPQFRYRTLWIAELTMR